MFSLTDLFLQTHFRYARVIQTTNSNSIGTNIPQSRHHIHRLQGQDPACTPPHGQLPDEGRDGTGGWHPRAAAYHSDARRGGGTKAERSRRMNGELIVERYPCLILYINTHSSIVNTHTNITAFQTHFVTRNNSIFSISQIKHGRPGPSNRPFLPGLSSKGKFVHTTTPCIPDDTSYQSCCAVSTQRCLRLFLHVLCST